MKLLLFFIIFNISCGTLTYGANILYLSLLPSPSHHIWDKTLAMALKANGHQITFVTHSPEKSVENFTTIIFEGIYEKIHEVYDYEQLSLRSSFETVNDMTEFLILIAKWDMETRGWKQLIDLVNKKPKIDLIIQDTTNGQNLYPIYKKLGNPPVIGTSQFGLQSYHTFSMGTDLHIAYNPIFFLPYTNKMNFCERVQNYIFTNYYLYQWRYNYMPAVWELSKKYFGNDIPPYQEFEKQFSLLLVNYDPVLDYPQSLPPAVIPVGGLHTKREKSLPKDLQKILDESKDGIVLFSLGTNFLSKDLKEDQKQALIDGLGRIKQTVLWKYEEEITGLPKNIITRNWLPQNDILAHPNLKAFLTHGGALSTQEAMFHAVPVISLPFFMDQYVNTEKMVRRKLGRSLKYGQMTADIVYEAVSDVLNNKEYKKNAELISKQYRDQKEDPLERAIWWIEYVIRHGGAQHLAVASRDLAFYQLNMLDFWSLVLISTLTIIFMLKKICCIFCKSKTCAKKSNNKVKKN